MFNVTDDKLDNSHYDTFVIRQLQQHRICRGEIDA
jgi:hypothetical protein